MITRLTARNIRRVVHEDFDLATRRIFTSPTDPAAAFVELVDGALIRVELTDDYRTALVDELPPDAWIC
jgi:hypothetical protein